MKATIITDSHIRSRLADIYRRLFDCYGPQHWWPGDTRDEIVIGAVLTQNTNWENVAKAITQLKAVGAVNLHRIQEMPDICLSQAIRPTGYYRLKCQRLNAVARELTAVRFDLLSTDEARIRLLSVNGVGPETADSILLYAFDRPVFVVDAYTRRIFSRLGIIPEKTAYESIRAFFQGNLPEDISLFNEYHALIVRHAKVSCRTHPQCADCPLLCECRFPKGTERP